jgi:hypothetical protein
MKKVFFGASILSYDIWQFSLLLLLLFVVMPAEWAEDEINEKFQNSCVSIHHCEPPTHKCNANGDTRRKINKFLIDWLPFSISLFVQKVHFVRSERSSAVNWLTVDMKHKKIILLKKSELNEREKQKEKFPSHIHKSN